MSDELKAAREKVIAAVRKEFYAACLCDPCQAMLALIRAEKRVAKARKAAKSR